MNQQTEDLIDVMFDDRFPGTEIVNSVAETYGDKKPKLAHLELTLIAVAAKYATNPRLQQALNVPGIDWREVAKYARANFW